VPLAEKENIVVQTEPTILIVSMLPINALKKLNLKTLLYRYHKGLKQILTLCFLYFFSNLYHIPSIFAKETIFF
jgi:hypothetical protein